MVMFIFDDNNNSHYHISSILKYDRRPSNLSGQGLHGQGQIHPETLQGAEAGEKLQKENQPYSTSQGKTMRLCPLFMGRHKRGPRRVNSPGAQGAQESRASLEYRVMVRPQVPEDSSCLGKEASEESDNGLEVRPMKELPPLLYFCAVCSFSPSVSFSL